MKQMIDKMYYIKKNFSTEDTIKEWKGKVQSRKKTFTTFCKELIHKSMRKTTV